MFARSPAQSMVFAKSSKACSLNCFVINALSSRVRRLTCEPPPRIKSKLDLIAEAQRQVPCALSGVVRGHLADQKQLCPRLGRRLIAQCSEEFVPPDNLLAPYALLDRRPLCIQDRLYLSQPSAVATKWA